MRFARVMAAALAATLTAGGCAHRLPWPPPAADIAEINQAAKDENGYLRVEYVVPIPPKHPYRTAKPNGIESIDDRYINFSTPAGETLPVASERVRGVTVKDRNLGGLIGGSLGAGAGAAAMGAFMLTVGGLGYPSGCSLECGAKAFGASAAIGAFVGMVIGYAVSGRRTYRFDRAP
jgi:hypothetical protein